MRPSELASRAEQEVAELGDEPDNRSQRIRWRLERRGAVLGVLSGLASIPVLSSAVHRVASGWRPGSDDAAIARLAHDVFSRHSPLLGMPSTLNGQVTQLPHHWGPMLFWLLAIPDRIFASSPAGLLLAAAVLNIACLVGIAAFVHRQLGSAAAAWLLALLVIVVFSLGQEVFSSIWNPDIAVMPLAVFVVFVWAVACGDTLALPFAVVAGSFVVQAHLLYTPLVAALGAWGIVGLSTTVAVRERGRWRLRLSARAQHLRRHVVVALTVGGLCWSTAVYQQLTGHPGNMWLLLHSGSHEGTGLGFFPAVHLITRTLSLPPLWTDGHSLVGYRHLYDAPSLLSSGLAAFVVLAPLLAVWARPTDHRLRALTITSLVMTVAALVTVTQLPVDFLGVNPYRVRFVWLVGAFAWFTLGAVAVQSLRLLRTEHVRVALGYIGASLLLAGSVAASGSHSRAYVDLVTDQSTDTISALTSQLRGRLSHREPYILRGVYLDNVGYGVMWDLVRHSFDIRLIRKDPYFGAAHPPPRGKMISTLVVIDHASARPVPGEPLLASARPPAATRRRLAREEAKLCAALERDPPKLTRQGRALLTERVTVNRQLALYRDRVVPIDRGLLARLVGGTPPCDSLRNPSLPLLLHVRAVTTSMLTESRLASFQEALSAANFASYDVYLEAP